MKRNYYLIVPYMFFVLALINSLADGDRLRTIESLVLACFTYLVYKEDKA